MVRNLKCLEGRVWPEEEKQLAGICHDRGRKSLLQRFPKKCGHPHLIVRNGEYAKCHKTHGDF
jgi:hypothetical protein